MAEEQKPVQTTDVEVQPGPNEPTLEGSLEQAKRAFALKNYELAVEHYAIALEIMTKKYGEASPECVDLYFAYGKALLENAIAQSSVLGKEETNAALADEENKASGSGRIHFSEDDAAENDSFEMGGEKVIDLFGEALKEQREEEEEEEDQKDENEEEADGELEDDFNAAWEILEVARSLYEAQKNVGDEIKLKLADTYMALGDISLETEKLEQAATDYTSAATLKTQLLPITSRQIAEVHYKLCIVYDMTSGRLAQSIEHARKAQASVQARLDEITARLKELLANKEEKAVESEKVDVKGKGKATLTVLEPALSTLTMDQLEGEIKDLTELLEEVSLKIEELKTSPDNLGTSAPDLVARELDRELNGAAGSGPAPKVVHDLTNVVRKKRKAPDASEPAADDSSSAEKKPKLEATETQ
ncbi:hypothetical protein Clacol_005345 [Clathrus columnatus]|uniref:Tetratricopeptide SHNi-TPR domain-containing protein n=1 Tax=Clathrus columnatus TaxID=1419009 RepID=A0AAV5A923_9AGAM|nr:hypothetical protein Clacol_005345 [Clathrus columnatus]